MSNLQKWIDAALVVADAETMADEEVIPTWPVFCVERAPELYPELTVGALREWQATRAQGDAEPVADFQAEIRMERDYSGEYNSYLAFISGGKSHPYMYIPETLDQEVLDEALRRLNTHPPSAGVPEAWRIAVQRAVDELSIMDESEGVAGFHLNGDVSPWDEGELPSVRDELQALLSTPTTPQADGGNGEQSGDPQHCPRCHSDSVGCDSSRELQVSEVSCGDCGFSLQAEVDEDTVIEMWNLVRTESCADYEEYADTRAELAEIDGLKRPQPPKQEGE